MTTITQIKAMKPKATTEIPTNNENLVYELKYDGGGGIIIRTDQSVNIFHIHQNGTLNTRPQNYKYPDLVKEAYTNLKTGVYHAELCVFNPEGYTHHTLFMKRQCENKHKIEVLKYYYPVIAMIHDQLFTDITEQQDEGVFTIEGENIQNFPLIDRKKQLMENTAMGEHIQLVQSWKTPEILIEQKDKIEGIVIKDINTPYKGGKREGQKFRFDKEETVKITDYQPHENGDGIVLITKEGRRASLTGNRVGKTKKILDKKGEITVEIQYYQKTEKGYRIPVIKRVIGVDT